MKFSYEGQSYSPYFLSITKNDFKLLWDFWPRHKWRWFPNLNENYSEIYGIHSHDYIYIYTVLVSIFKSKPIIIIFGAPVSAINNYASTGICTKGERVLCCRRHYSCMCITKDTYHMHERTYGWTYMPPAMCLVTPAPRKKKHLQGVGIAEQQKAGKRLSSLPCFLAFVVLLSLHLVTFLMFFFSPVYVNFLLTISLPSIMEQQKLCLHRLPQ